MIRIKTRTLSPTAINMYLSCPRKFYLRYIKRLKTRPSIYLTRGLIVHQTLHQFNKNHPETLSNTTLEQVHQELLTIFNVKWENAENSLNSLGLSEKQINDFHHESELMLLNFGQWVFFNGSSTADLAEARMRSNRLGVMGIIDAIHIMKDKVVLVDYKTSRSADITDDITRQAAIYALLYQENFNKIPEEVWIHFLKFPNNPQTIHIDENILTYGKILIESIHDKTTSIYENNYPCTCGGYCERDFIRGYP